MRRAAYQRAKILYDDASDDDHISLIQSVIMLGHWHADGEDRSDAWHWTGIAISMCQKAGLHCRATDSAKRSGVMTPDRVRLCRRIWWTCVVQDRWLSFMKGRPFRIRIADGNEFFPDIPDMELDLQQLPEHIKAKYLPYDALRVSRYWVKIIEISDLLGNIITQHTRSAIQSISEVNVGQCDWTDEDPHGLNVYEQVCAYHTRLVY